MRIGRYVIGLLSGLTFGMLFAPKRGKELRREIFEKGSESGMEGLKALGNAFKGAGEEAVRELKNFSEHKDVAELLDISKEKMRMFLDDAKDRGYDVAAYVQDKLEDLAGMARDHVSDIRGKAEDVKEVVLRKKAIGKTSYRSAKKKSKK